MDFDTPIKTPLFLQKYRQSLPACKLRGQRLSLALQKIGLNKQEVQASVFGASTKSMGRWTAGEPMAIDKAVKIAAKIIEVEGEQFAQWVFEGLDDLADTEPEKTTETGTEGQKTDSKISDRHADLIRAYRWLPSHIRIHFADRVLSVPTLEQPGHELAGSIDGQTLDDIEQALILKLRAFNDLAKEVNLIATLIKEASAWRH